jgi:exodeoxyribonuclease V alpha subunit
MRPDAQLAGWLADALAEQIERWALRAGADAALARRAARHARSLSLSQDEGHVCLPLDAEDAAALRASGVAGTPRSPGSMPLIVDDAARLYLHRAFDAERRLARRLKRAARTLPGVPPGAALRDRLDALFGPGAPEHKLAAALALRQGLVLISGGPGTGKTTTVVHLLALLLEREPGLRVALAAPTGKAAARLAQALRERAQHLGEAEAARLPQAASTVHRLLGAYPGGFTHDARNPLPVDLLIVDEASMLDLALAARLLDALPDGARVVLLGDQDQLAAVEAGAVFAEASADPSLSPECRAWLAAACGVTPELIVVPEPRRRGTLADSVVWLTSNFRFGAASAIGRLADAVRRSAADEVLALLREDRDAALDWLDDGGREPAAATLAAVEAGFAPYLQAVRRDPGDAGAVAAAFDRFRVLCAVRDGPRGVQAVNRRLDEHARSVLAPLHATLGGSPASPWYVGRPLIVGRNDALLGVFNGDVGFVLPDADGAAAAWFASSGGGWRAIAPQRLPVHDTAFATTVHKAQGSEFDAALLLMPDAQSRVATRELVYTALTRARKRVLLAGGAEAIARAVRTRTQRHSGLVDRLREADLDPR